MKEYLTKPVVYVVIGAGVILLIIGFLVTSFNRASIATIMGPNHAYNILQEFELPVVSEQSITIGRPYTNANVKIAQNYYDYRGSAEEQKNSIIYYEDTYIQSTGVSYSMDGETFDAIAVMDGEVVDVKEDTLLGNIVTIKHSSNMQTVYQSITDIAVKKGDMVTKGMLIGRAGESTMNSELGIHLYFELMIDNISVNPEEYYDKTL